VFPRRRTALFVHGCFWHGHDCPRGSRAPKQNADYWAAKIARNRARDGETEARLATLGWRSLTVWECELRDEPALATRLVQALRATGAVGSEQALSSAA
jgi:DNA mismatch endonuclease, patch repair protein